MTLKEDTRLSVVETKIDNIIEDMVVIKADLKISNTDLKEYISDKIISQKEAVGIAMAASKEAILKAEAANNLKFEIVNNVKETLSTEIANLRDDFDKRLVN